MADNADAGKSLAQLVIINDQRLSGEVADNLLEEAPVLARLRAIAASNGTDHHWIQYTTAPPVAFRGLNDGFVQGQSVDAAITTNCKIMDASYYLDTCAVANYTMGDLISRENARHIRTAMSTVEKQIFAGTATNGTGSSFGSDLGFEGIVDSSVSRLDDVAAGMVILAGGTTADVQSSVYLINDSMDSAAVVMGNDGNISVSPAFQTRIAGTTGHFNAWAVDIASYFAWQWGGTYSVSRIANVETGASLLTDDLLAKAIALHPANRKPSVIAMNRDAERQLRESRTATNPTGAPAPFAESAFGIPIVVTDSISGDEAVAS